jgi:V-type H+-transporting ATPase subunit a
VDTYGVPRYLEFNPGIITCITFPFLFGVMFGDILHGGCLLLLGIYLCNNNWRLKGNADYQTLLELRYMILLMGFFSCYNGFIYNDFAGMTLNIFGSCYSIQGATLPPPGETMYYTKKDCTYPFGVDPAWQGSLAFVNSLKMKLSVIIAYLHMTCGIFINGLN